MSHEIEVNFVNDWTNEASQCRNCTSFSIKDGRYICQEDNNEVPPTAHCDFFQSKD